MSARPSRWTRRSSSRRSARSCRRRWPHRQGRHRRLRRDPHVSHSRFPYDLLWSERVVRSVANLTRADGDAFFRIAADVPLEIAAEPMPLAQANEALERLRSGQVRGAAVLTLFR